MTRQLTRAASDEAVLAKTTRNQKNEKNNHGKKEKSPTPLSLAESGQVFALFVEGLLDLFSRHLFSPLERRWEIKITTNLLSLLSLLSLMQ